MPRPRWLRPEKNTRCRRCKKITFRKYKVAAGTAARMGPETHTYWCPVAGGYHITRQTVAEYQQRRASSTPKKEGTDGRPPVTPRQAEPEADGEGTRTGTDEEVA